MTNFAVQSQSLCLAAIPGRTNYHQQVDHIHIHIQGSGKASEDLGFMLPWSVPLTFVLCVDRSRKSPVQEAGMFGLTIAIAMDPKVS